MIIGIIGSGQLARMMMLAGLPMGLNFATYSPDKQSSLGELVQHVQGRYDDVSALMAFANEVDVVTYEHENLPADVLSQLEQNACLRPGSRVIANVQDRLLEKQLFETLGIPTNQFFAINNNDDLSHASKVLGYPFIIKSRRNGYDGKHQFRIQDEQALAQLMAEETLTDCIAESFVDFQREVSILAVRGQDGACDFYDVCENQHRDGILRVTENRTNDPSFESLCSYATKLLQAMDYVGVLAIEFFECNGKLIANEVAPRVHNSGHWTIEGAYSSQFSNHIRAVAGLPLGSCRSIAPVRMQNCIGAMPKREEVLRHPLSHYHDYAKAPREGRKLGHITTFIQHES